MPRRWLSILLPSVLCAGCGQEKIRVYQVPKEVPPATSGAPHSHSTPSDQAAPAGPTKPKWEVPSSWQEVPPSTMLVAKFLLSGQAEATAEVTVSVFPGDVGGLLANVNRWRNQINLPPVEEPDLAKLGVALPVESGGQGTIVDMTGTKPGTGQPVRLLGAIIPRGGQTWFFKLMGHASLAEQEKAAFLKFIQSVRYPNA
jgi:hypothetical protein